MKITIGIADDHRLFLGSLSMLINSFPRFEVMIEALNGEQLLKELSAATVMPDLLLIDVNMPIKNGPQTAAAVTQQYPAIRMVALSMKDDDNTIISMLKAGCCAYLLKDISPIELEKALAEIHEKGYYNSDEFNVNYRRLILKTREELLPDLNQRERDFLKLACSELTYKQIAVKMFLSERTVDGYRESLFQKLNVKSRVGMALEALRKGLVSL